MEEKKGVGMRRKREGEGVMERTWTREDTKKRKSEYKKKIGKKNVRRNVRHRELSTPLPLII